MNLRIGRATCRFISEYPALLEGDLKQLGSCPDVWWRRGIVLLDRVGGVADERDLNGSERIATGRDHGPQVAGASGKGFAV
jgi:hypothetical protein